MKIIIDQLNFIIGNFDQVIVAIQNKFKTRGITVLPCSLNDLATKKFNPNYEIYYQNVDVCTTDSMILTKWLSYKLGLKIERVYGPDLLLALFKKTNLEPGKTFFLGANKQMLEQLKNKIAIKNNNQFNFITLSKTATEKEEELVLTTIIKAKPNFLWLGIGSPKQIELAYKLRKQLPKTHIFCVGAALDFISGNKKQAPIWMQKNGLEWLFRLISEPQRLWNRYLISIPKYIFLKLIEKLLLK